MDVVSVSNVHIFWKHKQRSNKLDMQVLVDLAIPFKLGEARNARTFNNNIYPYTINKVETRTIVYEYIEDDKIKITNRETIEVLDNELTFITTRNSKAIPYHPEMTLFGFDYILSEISEVVDKKGSNIVCLYGPDGCGKRSLVNKLEIIYNKCAFIWVDVPGLLEKKESYLTRICNNVCKERINVVLVLIGAQRITDRLFDGNYMYNSFRSLMEDEGIDVKIVITCTDLRLMNSDLVSLITRKYLVPPPSDVIKLELIKLTLSKRCGRERCEENLSEVARSLRGYTCRNIIEFIDEVAIDHPELTVDQLKGGVINKVYQPDGLSLLIADVTPLRWTEIGGYEEVKEIMINQIQKPMLSGKKFDRGILLYGPPGCSKTMFARALATECNLDIFLVSPADIMAGYVGDSEANLREIMMHATASEPSIIFIDEIDMLLPKRDERNISSVSEKLLSELMTFMDGVDTRKDSKVIVMAATNYLEDIDEALVRRMSILIKIDLPDQASREAIIRVVFSDKDYHIDEDAMEMIPDLAAILEGMSGADIVLFGDKLKKRCRKQFVEVEGLPTVTTEFLSRIMEELGN